MKKDYRKIEMNILNDFIYGEVHDIYALVKHLYFRDMYMTIYEDSLSKLNEDDDLEKFIKVTYETYKKQNQLNLSLKVTSGKYYDDYLLKCVVHEVYKIFGDSNTLKDISKEDFRIKVVEYDKNCINNELMSEYNINFLTSVINNKFRNKENVKINEVIDFIKEISKEELGNNTTEDYFEYLNDLIKIKNITLNQLGQDSKIGKRIYDLSIDKLPTKNQLIMLVFALKLTKEECQKLFQLIKEEVKNTANSNKYYFDKECDRDKLLLHWMENIYELEKISGKTKRGIIDIVNDMLRQSKFDILY